MDEVSSYSTDELCDYVIDRVQRSAIFTLREQGIDGYVFTRLTENDLKDLFPEVGARLGVAMILRELRKNNQQVVKSKVSQPKPLCPLGSDWATSFEIPSRFTSKTMQALQDPNKRSKNARVEIVAALHTRMLQYTDYPTSYEYRTVAQRLVEKYPTLKDLSDNGYGTWKEQLKTRFRNGRRTHKRDSEQMDNEESANGENEQSAANREQPRPSRIKKKRLTTDEYELTDKDEQEYESNVRKLGEECKKEKPSSSTVKNLMKKTFPGRQTWIKTDTPTVAAVLDVFPPLKESSRLQRELTLIAGLDKSHDFMKDWPEWMDKLLKYGELEGQTRATIRSLVSSCKDEIAHLDQPSEISDVKAVHTVRLLKLFLANKTKEDIVHEFDDTIDSDVEAQKLPAFPQVMVLKSDMQRQYFIVVEKAILVNSKDMHWAILDLICTYFAFDIEYPKALYSIYNITCWVLEINSVFQTMLQHL